MPASAVPVRSSKRPVQVLQRCRCRCGWVSSHPLRITASLPQPGQRTPSGQRCWRTSAKHLASSSKAERLTRSMAAMMAEAPRTSPSATPALAFRPDHPQPRAPSRPHHPERRQEPSFFLKRKMLIDVLTLAALYTVRVIGGAVAVDVPASKWLLAFCLCIFMSLALIKRYVELAARLDANMPSPANRDYKTGVGLPPWCGGVRSEYQAAAR